MRARHHLEQRGLAGAVVAEQADHLAGHDVEVDAVERPDEAVVQVDGRELECRAYGGHASVMAQTFFWWTDRLAVAISRLETLVWMTRSKASDPSSSAPVTTVAQ